MKSELLDRLSRCHLFDGIPRSELRVLVEPRSCEIHEYRRGSIAGFRGDEYKDLWIILKGSLSAEFQDYKGRILTVETLSPVEPIATAVLFAPETILPVTLTADSDTILCKIPRMYILRMMQSSERFLLNYLQDSGLRLTVLAEKLRLIQFSTIREKIAGYLLELADKQGSESPVIPVSRETLSKIFGVSRPSLSREFSRLDEEGTIKQDGRHIFISSRESLEEILEG